MTLREVVHRTDTLVLVEPAGEDEKRRGAVVATPDGRHETAARLDMHAIRMIPWWGTALRAVS
jgi:hypothetical protein